MSRRSDSIESQWRSAKRFFILFPIWTLLIVGINIWYDTAEGRPFNFTNLLGGLGILACSIPVFIFINWIFKFVHARVNDEEQRR